MCVYVCVNIDALEDSVCVNVLGDNFGAGGTCVRGCKLM